MSDEGIVVLEPLILGGLELAPEAKPERTSACSAGLKNCTVFTEDRNESLREVAT